MTPLPDTGFPVPEQAGPGSVWADRVGTKRLIGRNQRGVEIPIGQGEGEINPGELLKLALIGCAGMSSDFGLSRRLGEDFAMRLWVHGQSDEDTNRYERIDEQIQLDLSALSPEEQERLRRVIDRAIAAGCTVERTVAPGVEVHHEVQDAGSPVASPSDGPAGPEGTATTEDPA
ncbi:OsmC family protein [Brachybacterium sp. AOP25-B2-12]|uniref:OsmC family protein n=1 Tax=Brachybacterium sp. AOP25-B2-12 TaxID=3457710 RepID=UPI004034838B